MKGSKNPNDAVRLLFDILYEKYKPRISYTPTIRTNHHHFRLDEVENENIIPDDDEIKLDSTLTQEDFKTQMNKKRGHQKSKSDVSGMIQTSSFS
jgi:hypothetical protein